MAKAKPIYCYETKIWYNSSSEAARLIKCDLSDLSRILNKSDKTIKGYHWCTDPLIFDGIELTSGRGKCVYCYETKKKYISIIEAAKQNNLTGVTIGVVIDNPNRTGGGFHWCTSLDIFDGIELTGGIGNNQPNKKEVYCYETKEKFSSLSEAAKFYKVSNSDICTILDLPNKTAGGYHWCTNLNVFDGIKLIGQSISVYCYETKQKFNSYEKAAKFASLDSGLRIGNVLNNSNAIAGRYHWCSDLSIFDGVELTGGIGSNPPRKEIFCYETKAKFQSITNAASIYKINIATLAQVIDNQYLTAAGYHWCTNLDSYIPIKIDGSIAEGQIRGYIESLGYQSIKTRQILKPLEIDIFIPELNLGIEYNGNYWHSENKLFTNNKDGKKYHQDKTLLAHSKDIKFIQIFEHQWKENPQIFKSVIANHLGKSIKIYARKCKIIELDNCTQFLDNNHLQGSCGSSKKLGLIHDGELVSVMTFGKSRFNKNYEYELLRFCNKLNTTIVGGASKLLKYFEDNYKPKSMISYANLQWSNGNLYSQLQFSNVGFSSPNYWWIRGNQVLQRYTCQKHKLSSLLGSDNFDINLTEKENMENNGYYRLFDCGNLIFIKQY